ncbi:MAG: hypothetical protein ACFFDH_10365 [Promethearchaeota archaeon]
MWFIKPDSIKKIEPTTASTAVPVRPTGQKSYHPPRSLFDFNVFYPRMTLKILILKKLHFFIYSMNTSSNSLPATTLISCISYITYFK